MFDDFVTKRLVVEKRMFHSSIALWIDMLRIMEWLWGMLGDTVGEEACRRRRVVSHQQGAKDFEKCLVVVEEERVLPELTSIARIRRCYKVHELSVN
jgi:hypothetical protein